MKITPDPTLQKKISFSRSMMLIGSHTECLYQMLTYGIPKEALPFDDLGQAHDENYFIDFWDRRRKLEQDRTTKGPRIVGLKPNPSDVLMGRGKSYHGSPGNIWFRTLIDQNIDRYEQGCKKDKTLLAMRLVDTIRQSNGRFLREDEDTGDWFEVDENEARAKVTHSFRNLRMSRKPLSGQSGKRRSEPTSKASKKPMPASSNIVEQRNVHQK